MNYKEFGNRDKETVILLHGGGLSWWNYRRAAEMTSRDFHVILPILDGHAGSDRHFTTIEDNASRVIDFINTRLSGDVFLIGGLSLGGQVLLEILSQQPDICRHAIIESAMAVPSKLTNLMISPAFGCSYPLIRQKWFARLQFKQLRMNDELFEDYYRDSCAITKQDMIAFMKANTAYSLKESIGSCTGDVHIYFGEKETRGIRQSARVIKEALPSAEITSLAGLYHGEFSLNHPRHYVKAVRDCLVSEGKK